jgi:hypothetical protein
MGPKFNKYHPPAVPGLHRTNADLQQWIRKEPEWLTFRVGDSMTFVPFNTNRRGSAVLDLLDDQLKNSHAARGSTQFQNSLASRLLL